MLRQEEVQKAYEGDRLVDMEEISQEVGLLAYQSFYLNRVEDHHKSGVDILEDHLEDNSLEGGGQELHLSFCNRHSLSEDEEHRGSHDNLLAERQAFYSHEGEVEAADSHSHSEHL